MKNNLEILKSVKAQALDSKKVINISDIKLGMELVKSFKTSKKNVSQVPYGMYI